MLKRKVTQIKKFTIQVIENILYVKNILIYAVEYLFSSRYLILYGVCLFQTRRTRPEQKKTAIVKPFSIFSFS